MKGNPDFEDTPDDDLDRCLTCGCLITSDNSEDEIFCNECDPGEVAEEDCNGDWFQ